MTLKLAVYLMLMVALIAIVPDAVRHLIDDNTARSALVFLVRCWGVGFWAAMSVRTVVQMCREGRGREL